MRKKPITATKKKKITKKEKNNLKKKVITKKKKITKKEKKKKKKEVCTETDGMTKMTKKTPTKMMKIADTGMDIGTDTETDSVKTTPVKNLKNRKNLKNLKKKVITEKKKLNLEKIKTKLSLNLKKSTKLNVHIHLIPADVVVKLVVDFLHDHNLCHSYPIPSFVKPRSWPIQSLRAGGVTSVGVRL